MLFNSLPESQNNQNHQNNGNQFQSHQTTNKLRNRVETVQSTPEVATFLRAIEESDVLSPIFKGQIDRLHRLNMLDTSSIQSYFSPDSARYTLENFMSDFIKNIQQGENGEFDTYKPRIFVSENEKQAIKDCILSIENTDFYKNIPAEEFGNYN